MIRNSLSFNQRARGLAYAGVMVICITALGAGGCYTRSIIPAQNLSRITVPNNGRELFFRDQDGGTVRVGPNSKIRFLVRGGKWTSWVEGRRLAVNRVGAAVRQPQQAPELVARWSDIIAAEVRNLSGGKTYGAIVGTTVLVGVVLLLIVGSAKGGGKGLGKIFKGFGKGVGRGLARGAMYRGFRLGVHLPHIHVSPGGRAPAQPVPGPVDTGNQPPPPAGGPPPASSGAPPPPPPPPPPGATSTGAGTGTAGTTPSPATQPPTAWTTPLPSFSRLTNRRAGIRFLGSVGVGSDLTTHDTLSSGAFIGLRAYDVFELALGARLYRHRGTRATASEDYRSSWMAVLRIGAHLDLDSRRWVALPIGVDVGGGHAKIHVRVNLGIRIRLTHWLHLGLYPFNPTYTHFKDDTLKRELAWWSFPSEVELAFSF